MALVFKIVYDLFNIYNNKTLDNVRKKEQYCSQPGA